MAWLARNLHVSPTERHGRPLTELEWSLFAAAGLELLEQEAAAVTDRASPSPTTT